MKRPVLYLRIAKKPALPLVGAASRFFCERRGRAKPGNLNAEIDEILASKQLPSSLAEGIDAVRVIGNFAAHPIKSNETGAIVDVEPGEAEWSLDILEGLFDFYYVQPQKLKAKRDALNQKLRDSGKPPLK